MARRPVASCPCNDLIDDFEVPMRKAFVLVLLIVAALSMIARAQVIPTYNNVTGCVSDHYVPDPADGFLL
jgi:hypothetical protein